MKKSLSVLCGISVAALLCCTPAFADTFNFSFTGSGYTGSGAFVANPNGTPGQYLIQSVTGTTNGLNITGIIPPGGYPPVGDIPNDNILVFPVTFNGALTPAGFSYAVAGGTDFNIYAFDGVYSIVTGAALDTFDLASFSLTDATTGQPIVDVGGTPVAATPEPSSLAMLATGAMGIAGVLRKRIAV